MLEGGTEKKSIILKKSGATELKISSIEDIACQGSWMLPKTGNGKIVSGGKGIEIWIKAKGDDYGKETNYTRPSRV